MTKNLFVFTDGGARGNPGPAAVGFVVKDDRGGVLAAQGKRIGRATNNVAEYQAVIEALKEVAKWQSGKVAKIEVFVDSKLVANQLNGFFKIKNKKLRELAVKVREKEQTVGGNVVYHFVSRKKNSQADQLVNQALGQKTKKTKNIL